MIREIAQKSIIKRDVHLLEVWRIWSSVVKWFHSGGKFSKDLQSSSLSRNVSDVLWQNSFVLLAEMSINSPETRSAATRSRDHLWGALTLTQDPLCASQAAANIRGSCGCECTVYLGCRSLFSGVKGHPYPDVLKIYGQMGPLCSKPPALFGLIGDEILMEK